MKKTLLILALAALAGTSCSKKLDITPPNKITDEQVKELIAKNPDLVIKPLVANLPSTVLTGGNTVAHGDWATMNLCQDLRGNDFVYASLTQSWHRDEYRFLDYRGENSGPNNLYWETALYKKISGANIAMNYLQDIKEGADATENEKKLMGYKAIAMTMRAYYYVYLGWIYTEDYQVGGGGKLGVPIYLKDDPYQQPQGRQTTEVLWKSFIIPDLQKAINLFTWSGTGSTPATDDVDASVANAILAYAAMTVGDWNTAIAAAEAVLAKYPTLMTETQYIGAGNDGKPALEGNGFTTMTMNPEAIFGFNSTKAPGGMSSFHGWMNIYGDGGGYGGSATGYAAIDQRLYAQMDADDYRAKNFRTTSEEYTYPISKNTQTLLPYFNLKFATKKPNVASPSSTLLYQDLFFFRASEMILLKAEAQLQAGDEGAAKTTINTLVAARTNGTKNIDNYGPAAVVAMPLLEKIQLQSRIELWGENGLEYYNNKRWNKGVNRTANGPTGIASGHTDAQARVDIAPGKAFTWQIPVTETNYNPGCAGANQNPF